MPRTSRDSQIIPGVLVHLISRFVDGRFLFDDRARHQYLRLLGAGLSRTDWRLIAYALMSSHIHLALISGRGSLDAFIHWVHGNIAQWLTQRSRALDPDTRGHAFADRPKTKVHPLTVAPKLIVYQHRNPVTAGVIDDPAASTWTSHRAYVGLDPAPPWLDVTLGLGLAGLRNDDAGRAAFAHAVETQRVTHDDLEKEPVIVTDDAHARSVGAIRTVRTADPADLDDVVALVAARLGLPPDAVASSTRSRRAARARRLALLVWRALGGRQAVMARHLGLSETAASNVVQRSDVESFDQDVAFILGHLGARVAA